MGKSIHGNIIQIEDLSATVKLNNGDTLVTVNNANMELKRGYSYAVMGKSGSGKTSLISIIGLLNRSYEEIIFTMGLLFPRLQIASYLCCVLIILDLFFKIIL